MQSITLLSGGEKTMTAVALLFSIYMVKPSPFCVLDEMDAPLDESNINRFIKILDRFVGQSQFVVISHHKRTIARADALYGVTMEEHGVSKLVGVKFSTPRRKPARSEDVLGHQQPRARAQRRRDLWQERQSAQREPRGRQRGGLSRVRLQVRRSKVAVCVERAGAVRDPFRSTRR